MDRGIAGESAVGEILKFKTVVEKTFAPQCSYGSFILKFHLLDHVAENLEKFGSLSSTKAAPFEHFYMLI